LREQADQAPSAVVQRLRSQTKAASQSAP
jgi:hypothetical protein